MPCIANGLIKTGPLPQVKFAAAYPLGVREYVCPMVTTSSMPTLGYSLETAVAAIEDAYSRHEKPECDSDFGGRQHTVTQKPFQIRF